MLMFRPESGSECRRQTKNFYFLIHSIYYFKLQHILCLLFNPGWRWILHLNFVGEILHGLLKSLLITRKVSRDCGVEQKKLLGHNLHLTNTSIEQCLICIVLLPCCHQETSAWSEHRIVTSQTPASSRWTSPGSPPASSDWSQCRELPCRTQDQSCTRHTPPGLSRTSSPWPGSPPWSCSRWCWRSWRRSWGKQGVVVHFWWDCVEPPRCRGTLAAALVTCEQDQRNILQVNSKKNIWYGKEKNTWQISGPGSEPCWRSDHSEFWPVSRCLHTSSVCLSVILSVLQALDQLFYSSYQVSHTETVLNICKLISSISWCSPVCCSWLVVHLEKLELSVKCCWKLQNNMKYFSFKATLITPEASLSVLGLCISSAPELDQLLLYPMDALSLCCCLNSSSSLSITSSMGLLVRLAMVMMMISQNDWSVFSRTKCCRSID